MDCETGRAEIDPDYPGSSDRLGRLQITHLLGVISLTAGPRHLRYRSGCLCSAHALDSTSCRARREIYRTDLRDVPASCRSAH
ncbi:hypothetical protein ACFFX0_25565 [Citricoccus parietis]|uniref:Uncharacterized protein n=1 Tax=Citricoccus parietis TaxID=592307 RepID=A0ABV5G5Z5_9MICC